MFYFSFLLMLMQTVKENSLPVETLTPSLKIESCPRNIIFLGINLLFFFPFMLMQTVKENSLPVELLTPSLKIESCSSLLKLPFILCQFLRS